MSLRDDIVSAINSNSAENGSNTPDFILGEFLTDCLRAFDAATNMRETWHGRAVTVHGTEGAPAAPPSLSVVK
jgi:hypothetical protein